MSFYRVKPRGRFVHKCTAGCGVWIKARKIKCMGCVTDLLSNRRAGAWREDLKSERKNKKEQAEIIVAETRAIYAGASI